jgi:hypothetical protein
MVNPTESPDSTEPVETQSRVERDIEAAKNGIKVGLIAGTAIASNNFELTTATTLGIATAPYAADYLKNWMQEKLIQARQTAGNIAENAKQKFIDFAHSHLPPSPEATLNNERNTQEIEAKNKIIAKLEQENANLVLHANRLASVALKAVGNPRAVITLYDQTSADDGQEAYNQLEDEAGQMETERSKERNTTEVVNRINKNRANNRGAKRL